MGQLGGCQPLPPVSYCAFPSLPASGLQSCIEETLLVIGFFAKIVGSGERRGQSGAEKRGGRAANCRFDRLLFISHRRSCPPAPPAAHHRLAGTLHDAGKTHIAFPHSKLHQPASLRSFRSWWKLDPILTTVCSLIQKVISLLKSLAQPSHRLISHQKHTPSNPYEESLIS